MEPFSPIPNLMEQVHARLVDAIADGTLLPGQRLTQEDIAERLSVSRQPVSHALQLLRRQGLVIESGKRGVEVAPVEAGRIRDLYQVRAALDGLASRLAAERVAAGKSTPRETEALRAGLTAGRTLPEDASIHDWIAVDVAFHSAIYALSGNTAVAETVAEQWPHFKRCMGAVLVDRNTRNVAWNDHIVIAERILAGDPGGATEISIRHAEFGGNALYARLSADTVD